MPNLIMKNYLCYILVTTTLSLTCVNADSEQKYFIHPSGFGPVTIGMTVIEASNALGENLIPAHLLNEDDKHCHYVYPDGDYERFGFMVEDGLITRIDVRNNSYFTDSGITVGQNEIKIREKYKNKITEKIHPYISKEEKYLIVDTTKGYQLIFETDRGKITTFRTGKLPSVSYIEVLLINTGLGITRRLHQTPRKSRFFIKARRSLEDHSGAGQAQRWAT